MLKLARFVYLCPLLQLACAKAGSLDQRDAGESLRPRYWLTRSLPDDGPVVLGGTNSVLVEIMPDGRLRNPLDPLGDLGALPTTVFTPTANQGLMLYAQRELEVHLRAPYGPAIGRLYRGAMVAVSPGDEPFARIALALDDRTEPAESGNIIAYVQRDGLDVHPCDPAPRLERKTGQMKMVLGDLRIHGDGGVVAVVAISRCEETWFSDSGEASQYVAGVEITGTYEAGVDLRDARPVPPRDYSSVSLCRLRAVVQEGAKLLLSNGPRVKSAPLASIPSGFAAVTRGSSSRIRGAVEHGKDVFWLVLTHSGLICEDWQLRPVAPTLPGSPSVVVARLVPVRRDPGDLVLKDLYWGGARGSYWVTYEPPRGQGLAKLLFSDRHPAHGRYEFTYTLLAEREAEVSVTALSAMDDGIVAYDPNDAERWFFSAEACEAARQAAATSEANSRLLLGLGLHVREP